MPSIISIALLMIIFVFSLNYNKKKINHSKNTIYPILIAAYLIRIIFACIFDGHETDMNCFNAWSGMLASDGISEFYTSGQFTDYPPGYMYILYFIGLVKNMFSMSEHIQYILLKQPAIICDIICGYIVYKIADKYNTNPHLTTSLYLFNPAIILNSAVWGQVDSVFTLPILIMLCLIINKKLIVSYFLFAIAIFIKPQALFYAPILLYAIIEQVFLHDFSWQKFYKHLLFGILAIASIFVLALPFGIAEVLQQYQSTISSYNFASVNAYNLWSAIGLNWSPLTTYETVLGYVSIILIVILCGYKFFKMKTEHKYFLISSLICFSVFVLSVKMHERYAFPCIILLLCSFAATGKKNTLKIYAIVSAFLFINSAHVLFFYDPATYYTSDFHYYTLIFGIISLIILALFWFYSFSNDTDIIKEKKEKLVINRIFNITKKDMLILYLITIVYSIIAFYNLGDLKAPETYTKITPDKPLTIELNDNTDISEIKIYNGFYELSDNRQLSLTFKDEFNNIIKESSISSGGVFYWIEENASVNSKIIEISSTQTASLFEIGIFDNNGLLVTPINSPMHLFDEQEHIPAVQSFKNSTYFDEIYHARTAYEYINKLPVYEWTHPPLGKIFISLGINLFGMSPFGWRIIGTLFGIFMIPVIYIFIKKMFGQTWLSACGATLLSADFMHFTQSRIATIDVYVTFFILLMYLYMFKYYNDEMFIKNPKKGYKTLLLCGTVFGLSVASKWTGLYAGVGLCIIFFLSLIDCYKKDKTSYNKRFIITCSLCILFFIVIPIIIYVLSYIPYLIANNIGISGIIENQESMYIYHSKTVVDSTHPFSSLWYEWIFDLRPIWYYSSSYNVYAESISSFGNPLIWWIGFISFIYCLYKAINTGDKKAILLVIAYMSGIIPWTFVDRTTYIYHYFPSVPFLIIIICYVFDSIAQYTKNAWIYCIIFTVIAVILFFIFYPAISGFSVKQEYLEFLKWLPGWQII